ncbi:uncharacterized protein Z520_05488 [Fonsecaea multimorphosa CBS 102226]|uniref:Helicase C-terminal domain-containing protein n=1 Tax=Fonsecaea multimorphosa CBS 102226 TaxID=1442371 RepID=A0A0D2JZT1_9EURO|nr:uncharacterized protein Z520_05488 [Fonsecaea multimorphosa CBS 102226]KIX99027.1 hypothetical protein Z520_05488 [Fonsecaea multimorphosa CBS 102226]OAL25294.1 hypothetical protein AYO22_05171 [Fonsecaea multimorphosa]
MEQYEAGKGKKEGGDSHRQTIIQGTCAYPRRRREDIVCHAQSGELKGLDQHEGLKFSRSLHQDILEKAAELQQAGYETRLIHSTTFLHLRLVASRMAPNGDTRLHGEAYLGIYISMYGDEGRRFNGKTVFMMNWAHTQWGPDCFLHNFGIKYLAIWPGTTAAERSCILARWNDPDDDARFLLLNSRPSALGLNIQGACHKIVIFDMPDNIPPLARSSAVCTVSARNTSSSSGSSVS